METLRALCLVLWGWRIDVSVSCFAFVLARYCLIGHGAGAWKEHFGVLDHKAKKDELAFSGCTMALYNRNCRLDLFVWGGFRLSYLLRCIDGWLACLLGAPILLLAGYIPPPPFFGFGIQDYFYRHLFLPFTYVSIVLSLARI